MTDLGKLRMFLGIEINRSDDGMFLSQQVYTRQILKKFGMEECKAVRTPMVIKPGNDGGENESVPEKPFRELIGSLMFLMLNTRPDISAAINFYSRFQSNPKRCHSAISPRYSRSWSLLPKRRETTINLLCRIRLGRRSRPEVHLRLPN